MTDKKPEEKAPVVATTEGAAQATKMDTGANRAFKITLPSQGFPYGDQIPGGVVEMRPMTTAEEAILYNAAGDGVSKISAIINACFLTKSIATEDLLLTDRFYLLLMLRTRSFGARYDFPIRCQYCSAQSKASINLATDLGIKPIEPGFIEPFEVKLPLCGDTLGLRLLRGKDEARIAKHAKRMRLQTVDQTDPSYLYRLALQIVTINGKESNLLDTEKYVSNLIVGDSRAIQLATEDVEGGADTTLFIDCPMCGASNEMELPFSVEFFRPSR